MATSPESRAAHQQRHDKFYAAIGKGISAYAKAEWIQILILQCLLGSTREAAALLFLSLSSVRARNEVMEGLLKQACGEDFKAYWAQCSRFLSNLSVFRNAIVHWNHSVRVRLRVGPDKTKRVLTETDLYPWSLHNPLPSRSHGSIDISHFPNFMTDVDYIHAELYEFLKFLVGYDGRPESLPEKYLKPAIRPNLARLPPPRNPKASSRQQQPSPKSAPKAPKQSRKQRRQRALAEAARRKK